MKTLGSRLFGITFLLSGLFLSLPAEAFEVKGKVKGLKPGEPVYLMTSPEGTAEHKWCTTVAVDSCCVNEEGAFSFTVKDRAYATLWTLKTKERMLKFFFSADEDLAFEGRAASFGIHGKETVHGNDQVAMQDVFAAFEDPSLNPVKQRMAVEWMKRHAGDDVVPWAASYFSHVDPFLSPEEVGEILAEVPSTNQQNPYYKKLKAWYDVMAQLKVGAPYRMPEWKTADGKTLDAAFYKGHPVLLYSCNNPEIGGWYAEYAHAYAALTEKYPDLRILLLHPTFQKEEANAKIAALGSDRICSLALEDQSALNPDALNIRSGVGTLLLNPEGRISNITSNTDKICEVLDKNYDPTRVFEINGYVEGSSEGVAELLIFRDEVPTRIDTAVVENGYFHFYGQFDHPVVCYVGLRGQAEYADAFLENANIQMYLNSQVAFFKGEKYRRVTGRISGAPIGEEFKEAMALESPAEVEDWLKEHRSSWAAFNRVALWTDLEDPEVLDGWMKLLDPKFKAMPEYEIFQKKIAMKRKISQGSLAPDFTLKDPNGQDCSLSDYRGKYVLLDFWASWCGPCKKAIPTLKKVWNEYRDKGFDIISVSIDDSEKAWKKAVEQEKMPWRQVWRNKTNVDRVYFVSSIPHLLLIGPDGKIIHQHLAVNNLEEVLQKCFQ